MEKPQFVLPLAEREYVDAARCARIFGTSAHTVYRLAATVGFDNRPLISLIEYRRGAWKRVLYSSIVHFCDKLRSKYNIPDRRAPLSSPIFRHRDEDLLPFPLADTIKADQVREALGYSWRGVVAPFIEEGLFEGYRLAPYAGWRISRTSFLAYLNRVKDRPSTTEEPYRGVARPRGLAGKFTSE